MTCAKKAAPLRHPRLLSLLALLPWLGLFVAATVLKQLEEPPLVSNFLFAACFLSLFLYLRFFPHFFSALVRRPLLQDLDLDTYRANLALVKWDVRSPVDNVMLAYASGDHQRLLSVAFASLSGQKDKRVRFMYLSWIEISQFMMGDFQQLMFTLAEIERLAADDHRVTRLLKKHFPTHFIRYFLARNLTACEALCDRVEKTKKLSPLAALLWEWFRTVIYTERGEKERAKVALHALSQHAQGAPVFLALAKAQLDALETQPSYVGLGLRLSPYPFSGVIPNQTKLLRARRILAVMLIVLFILYTVSAIEKCVTHAREQREWQALSDKVTEKVALAMPDEAPTELLAYVKVRQGADALDDICVLRRANGDLMIGTYYVVEGEDGTTYFAPYCPDLKVGEPLEIPANFNETHTVCYVLYDNEAAIPARIHSKTAFDLDGETLYFCVTEIKEK